MAETLAILGALVALGLLLLFWHVVLCIAIACAVAAALGPVAGVITAIVLGAVLLSA